MSEGEKNVWGDSLGTGGSTIDAVGLNDPELSVTRGKIPLTGVGVDGIDIGTTEVNRNEGGRVH